MTTKLARRSDPRIGRMFASLREVLDIAEDMMLHPYQQPQPPQPAATPTPAPTPAGPPGTLVTWKELKSVFGLPYSRAHIYRLEEAGQFPAHVKLGAGRMARTAWRAVEIEQWINSRR